MKKLFLGIDTSNYMTSICFIDENRKVVYEAKKLLEVKMGEKGLQQSEALFQHIHNLPNLFKNSDIPAASLSGIGVSKAPRPVEGSYMPVFMAGLSLAESIHGIFKVPLYYTTHQEGHIAAGLFSSTQIPEQTHFLAVHLSGGTSEILDIQSTISGFLIEKIGGTLDLHAGQLIDRIGVILGLEFPAGKYLEQIAKSSSDSFKRIPSSLKGLSFNLSGAENEAKRRLTNGEPKEEVARAIEHLIGMTLVKALTNALELGHKKEILVVGGVAQNQYIRDYLVKKLEHQSVGAKLFFADKNYSGDNAFGVANIALNNYIMNT